MSIVSRPAQRRLSIALTTLMALPLTGPASAGPLADLLMGGRNDYYYPVGDQYARGPAPGAAPVTAYYTPPGGAPTAVQSGYAPPAAATVPQSSGYAPAPAGMPAGTLLSPAAGYPSTSTPSGGQGVTTYRLTAPMVTAPVAAAPISGVTNLSPTSVPVASYPGGAATTSYYAPSAAVPTTTNYVTSNMAAANLSACSTCQAPNVSYRTVWYRIPVTNYRPVTTADPCTGCATTVMRPCTTFTWQARRVPDERPRSWFSRLFCCFHRRQPPPVAPVAVQPMTVTNCVPTTTTYGCPPAPAATTAPYYSAPAGTSTTAPANVYPGGSYPSAAPGGSVPPGEPADYPPTLGPNPNYQQPGAAVPGSAMPTEGSAQNWPNRSPMPGQQTETTSMQATEPAGALQSTGQTRVIPRLDPQPVPDPDAVNHSQPQQRFEPPKLLNPRDRSAAVQPRAGAFVLIAWPEKASARDPVAASAAEPQAEPAAPRAQRGYDDSGWKSAR